MAIGRVNAAGGTPYAAVRVTYPTGSVCTCTDGTRTLTAKDTTGTVLFFIPSAGTWTVTATDGTNTKSGSVEITSEGQVESVTLSYAYYIIQNGNCVITPTAFNSAGSYSTSSGTVIVVASTNKAYGLKFNTSFTGYTKVTLVISSGSKSWYGGQCPGFGVSASSPSLNVDTGVVSTYASVKMLNSATGDISAATYSVPIPTSVTSGYVWVTVGGATSLPGSGYLYITSMYLE